MIALKKVAIGAGCVTLGSLGMLLSLGFAHGVSSPWTIGVLADLPFVKSLEFVQPTVTAPPQRWFVLANSQVVWGTPAGSLAECEITRQRIGANLQQAIDYIRANMHFQNLSPIEYQVIAPMIEQVGQRFDADIRLQRSMYCDRAK
jgi:hypothetical protein